PNFFMRGLPEEEVQDGLYAPICLLHLSTLGDQALLGQVAGTHSATPGKSITVLAKGNLEDVRALSETPLLHAPAGWPIIILPTAGGVMLPVSTEDLIGAKVSWSKLIQRALSIRYGPQHVIELNPD